MLFASCISDTVFLQSDCYDIAIASTDNNLWEMIYSEIKELAICIAFSESDNVRSVASGFLGI